MCVPHLTVRGGGVQGATTQCVYPPAALAMCSAVASAQHTIPMRLLLCRRYLLFDHTPSEQDLWSVHDHPGNEVNKCKELWCVDFVGGSPSMCGWHDMLSATAAAVTATATMWDIYGYFVRILNCGGLGFTLCITPPCLETASTAAHAREQKGLATQQL